jgi:AcrR family transcriptional regulator
VDLSAGVDQVMASDLRPISQAARENGFVAPELELYLTLLDESLDELIAVVQAALVSAKDNKERVSATLTAFFDFVSGPDEAFRLVFESDLGNEPAVRQRLNGAMHACADLIGLLIRDETGLADDEAQLLAVALVGMAQTSVRYWRSVCRANPDVAAVDVLGRLAWRGLSSWPSDKPLGDRS